MANSLHCRQFRQRRYFNIQGYTTTATKKRTEKKELNFLKDKLHKGNLFALNYSSHNASIIKIVLNQKLEIGIVGI